MILWSAEEAVRNITRDGLLDLISITNDPDWLIRSTCTHRFSSTVGALLRCKGAAEISVKLGEIKDPDTPLNWIGWARRKGYNVDHLRKDSASANLPEKMPNIAIGRVAIEVACEIKQESGIMPAPGEVMEKLRHYAKSGDKYTEVLRPSPPNYRGRGVYWVTTGFKNKEFTIEACSKTMERYFKRQ